MKQRCEKDTHVSSHNYKGRGTKVLFKDRDVRRTYRPSVGDVKGSASGFRRIGTFAGALSKCVAEARFHTGRSS